MKTKTKIIVTLAAGVILLIVQLYIEGAIQIGGPGFELKPPTYWSD
jgi:hypothetical protein